MRKHIIAVAILSSLGSPAFATDFPVPDGWRVVERIELKDGNFVNVYKDGKMAMECKFGHALTMTPGHAMQAKDGRTVTMVGNETFRVTEQNPLISQPRSF